MIFQVDPSNGVPVYEQIVRQMTFSVACGALRTGELVPSVRQLAKDLAINPNTVARAYRQLQDSGVLQAMRGTGMQVANGAEKHCKSERIRFVSQRMRDIIREAQQGQLSDEEIIDLFQKEVSKSKRKKG